MAYIQTVDPADAEGVLAREYEKALKATGRVSNIRRLMSLNPESMRSSMRIYGSIMFAESPLTRAQREMLAVVVSQANDCHY